MMEIMKVLIPGENFAIMEGSRLKYEMLSYELID
jgi:hypothetical protein